MASKKAGERDKKMLDLLQGWKALEERTVTSCDRIYKKTKNPVVKTLITIIKSDSKKHKSILKFIIESMTKKAMVLSPEELATVATLLNKHLTIEQKSITTAQTAIEMSRDAVVKQLLKLILEEERRHEKLIEQINTLKFQVTARVT
jgi:Mn-containing catalase